MKHLIEITRKGEVIVRDDENMNPIEGAKAEIIDSAEGMLWVEVELP